MSWKSYQEKYRKKNKRIQIILESTEKEKELNFFDKNFVENNFLSQMINSRKLESRGRWINMSI